MKKIHPTALVAEGAHIADDVTIGPYCTVGAHVAIGRGSVLVSHVVVDGHTTIGENNYIFPFVSLGQAPQDLKYKGEPTRLVIGNGNKIREFVTMNLGTAQDEGVTRIGDNNLFMASVHIAHDCMVHNGCVFANCATLGGHVHVGDNVVIGGLAAVHQWVHIGRHAIIGGQSGVSRDVPPFVSAVGNRATLEGLNLVGLRRRNFDKSTIRALRDAFDAVFLGDEGHLLSRAETVAKEFPDVPEVQELVQFCKSSSRGICLKGTRFYADDTHA